ncbi:amino acid adenylation domain-containing protein [Rhodococcus sp. BP-349]|uniref:non-ribosomal peptide synthetase n=1 Tax=unclassified Rhodococcus (in: high G+C Gram-positive bacteria) TaxID=192944 RepID=UPI001C9AB6CE|nr:MULTISPECIES: non-ribosomal peptide synthetase [unclassified Rhodococcus (in: high G+C Gram-positive bacteria)]MBY6538124.1 amino acid adenylation domain-containing protein [Rhodococcus sp. BP-363]MBY6542461.1 amino acid adenylation domain-containing protein [Rhodococcus sp. BP-369]MBY6561691.1 amino acid adenylation domain-containing protein [Rhodococcus sp. BP-370]MBY6575983.1 amino acid adenylation domain-containing protein [Rhodococcus sp. BP-364]MBY6585284.1 amino acid adenylation doma
MHESDDRSFPLSAAQRSIWFAQELDPETPLSIAQYVDVHGPLDTAVLEKVGRLVAREFDTVMVRLVAGDPEPRQIVDDSLRDTIAHLDFRDETDPVASATAWMRTEVATPVDMYESRLMEVATLRVADQRWFWYTRVHHVLLDGYGAAVFADRAAELYDSLVTGAGASTNRAGRVAQIVADEAAYRASPRFLRDAEYWTERLAGLGDPVRLAEASGRRDVRSLVVGESVDVSLLGRIESACARWSTSTPALISAATALYYARMADVTDVSLSLPVSARTNALLRRSGGMVSNVVPLRAHVGPRTTASQLVNAMGREIVGALRHQRYRFEDMRDGGSASTGGAGTGRGFFGPPINIMTFRNDTVLGPCTGRAHILTTGPIDDLAVNVHTGGGGLRIDLEANPTVYSVDEVADHRRRLLHLLGSLVDAGDDDRVLDLDHGLRVVGTVSGEPTAEPVALPDVFDRTVRHHGDRTAIVSDDRRLTYREWDSRANRLARMLVARGVGPGTFVAVVLTRGIHSVVAQMAVSKAGGAFLPVDPALPDDRIDFLLADSGVTLGIVDEPRPDHDVVSWIDIGARDVVDEFSRQSTSSVTDAERRRPLRIDHPAYMIYTSGSTGSPKGVVIGHRGIASLAAEQIRRYDLDSRSRTLHFASPSFDASILELLLAIGSGATMVIVPPDVYGGEELARLLSNERVTHAFVTPAALASVEPGDASYPSVVIVGGEACSPALVGRWAPGRRMFNAYGPTECTVMVTLAGPLEPGRPVTIGGPVTGTSVIVLDHRLRPVPEGAVGELYVAGSSEGLGYHDRAPLTATRYLANPWGESGSRLYRTGDVVRTNADSTLSYLGRSDHQVKVRGFRIELGEVDAALHGVPGIARAVSAVREVAGHPALVAYVQPVAADVRRSESAVAEDVVSRLRDLLPAHAVPSFVMVQDQIPLTSSGKVDRTALPTPMVRASVHVAPRTATEVMVADAFATVLGPRTGPDGAGYGTGDHFFELGGNSLIATRLTSVLGAAAGTRVPVRAVFESPTVGALATRVDAAVDEAPRVPLTRVADDSSAIPLSPAQHRMWVLNQFDIHLATYNVPIVLRLRGTVDVEAIGAAVFDLVARHGSLRTSYPDTPDGPIQLVHDIDEMRRMLDVTPRVMTAAAAADRIVQVASTGFDVSATVPIRVEILQVATDHVVLACVVHHISADGSSTLPLARDLTIAYRARTLGVAPQWDELPVRYIDYTVWHHDHMGSDSDPGSVTSRQLAFWSERLSDPPERLDLPFDRPRPAVSSLAGGRVVRSGGPETPARLSAVAAEHSVTPFMVFHAALAILLARWSGTVDVSVGTPVAGRDDPATEHLVGMFVNTVVLRTRVDGHTPFSHFLRDVRDRDLEAFENADVPFDRLVELVNPVRTANHHPLVQYGFSYQNLAPTVFDLDGVNVEVVEPEIAVAKFDLHLTVVEGPAGPEMQWEYATDLFDRDTVERIADDFESVLDAALRASTTPVGDLAVPRLSPIHPAPLPTALSPTALLRTAPSPDGPVGTVADLLESGLAAGADDAVALVEDESARRWTFEETRGRVRRLARLLIARGVGPDTRVVVAMPRSALLVETLWAIVLAGGTYVPVDPEAPVDRVASVFRTSGATMILTTTAEQPGREGVDVVDVRNLDTSSFGSGPIVDAERPWPLREANGVYVIYTSGSTGAPKGVALSHGAVATQLRWKRERHPMTAGEFGVLRTPVTFDLSVWELMGPVLWGTGTVIARPDGHRDPRYVADLIGRHPVRTVHFVPSLLEAHLDTDPTDLDRVLCIGESLAPRTAERAARSTGAAVENLYGPTEAAVAVTVHSWRSTGSDRDDGFTRGSDPSVPIGRPVAGTGIHVLDRRLHPVPRGVPGELYLSGPQLASWYEGRPDLTAERFVADPADVGGRMYRTGDLVRVLSSGDLEFLGRNDFQLKLRGQRIELGEIEAALSRDRRIASVAVDVHRGQHLVAYVVAAAGADTDTLTPESMTAPLSQWLPGYMIPSSVMLLPALPTTVNGKLDRASLPEPAALVPGSAAPTTATELHVAAVVASVLDTDATIGVDDDFFRLGGNSLAATRVAARLGTDFGVDVPVSAVFADPTVRGLARVVDAAGRLPRPPLTAGPRPAVLPLSRSQFRMWIINQLDTGSPLYNLPLAIRLTGEIDVEALSDAVGDVIERHEVLRTVYPTTDGQPAQRVLAASVVTRHVGDAETMVSRGFDLSTEPPVRWTLRVDSSDDVTLVMVVHHIAADAGSFRPLVADVVSSYEARVQDTAPSLRPLPVQVADHALWQQDLLGGAGGEPHASIAPHYRYWAHALADPPGPLPLPTDRPPLPVPTRAGATVRDEVSADVLEAVRDAAAAERATVFMAVHTALAVTLARVTGADDILIGTPVDGRGRPELDDLVGMFVSTVVLRTRIDVDAPPTRHLAQSRDTVVAALAASDVPFEDVVAMTSVDRSSPDHPLFRVMLGAQDALPTAWEHAGLHLEVRPIDLPVARFDLHVTIDEPPSGSGRPLGVTWTYATDLFDESTIVRMNATFRQVLDALVRRTPVAVGDLEVMTPSRRALIDVWTEGPPRTGQDGESSSETVVDLLDRAAHRHTGTPAITVGATTTERSAFAAMVARAARHLISVGVGPETVVAVALPRSLEMMVALHAVVTAGGAALPLDLDQPAARVSAMLQRARPLVVLADDPSAVPGTFGARMLSGSDLMTVEHSDRPVTDEDRLSPLRPQHPCYVIFTSGSTGEPKGVSVPHAGIVNRLRWMQASYPIGVGDTVLHKTPVTFDVSVWELYWGLITGARTVVAEPDAHRDPARIAALVDDERVTVVHFVPSVLDVFLASTDTGAPSLRLLFTSGEALMSSTASRALRRMSASMHNLYGPTEASVDVTSHPVSDRSTDHLESGAVPIGRPVTGTRTYVLDARLHPVDAGIAGELYLGGVQLARGYVGRGALTAARFVADPCVPGERIYRTGDLVRWSTTEPGVLEFLGRTDFQVKIRGLRIETGEIDAAIRSHPAVSQCIVVVRDELVAAGELVAYVVAERGRHLDHEVVIGHARTLVPDHMVPARTVVLQELPTTSAGKVDRRRLPVPARTARTRTAPRTPTEAVVLDILRVATGDVAEDLGVDSDFFDVGGNSLTAATVMSAVSERLGVSVGLRAIFEKRTASGIAALVDSLPRTRVDSAVGAVATSPDQESGSDLMTAAQIRMWVHNRLDPASAAYHIVLPVSLDVVAASSVDVAHVRSAVRDVVARHEALRTVYPDTGDGPRPRRVSAEVWSRAEILRDDVAAADVTARALEGFDLTTDLPVRVVIDAQVSMLVLVVHHIAADGWSMRVLAEDLGHAVAARQRGEEPTWDTPAPTFADVLLRRHRRSEHSRRAHLDHWVRVLAGAPALGVPAPDRPRPDAPSYRGAVVRTRVQGVTRAALSTVAARAHASAFSVFHSALVATLARSGAGDDIVIGLPTAGREDPTAHRTVGMFVTMLALRTRYRPTSTFTEGVAESRDVLLEALEHADVDIEDVVDAMAATREPSHHPVFQTTLDVDDSDPHATSSANSMVSSMAEMDVAVARFDLEFTVHFRGDEVELTVVHRTDIYETDTVRALLDRWALVLRSAVAMPDRPLRTLDVRLPDELIESSGGGYDDLVPVRSIADIFAGVGDLVDGGGGEGLSAEEGRAAVHRLARLLRGRGIGVGDVVAVCVGRSIDSVVAVRAVADVGAAFVPIDPSTPPDRIALMVADSAARAVLTTSAVAAGFDPESTIVLDSSDVQRLLAGAPSDPSTDGATPTRADAPAYLIYTSGSTGTPKAVVVTHRGLSAFTEELCDRLDVRPGHRVLHAASPSFDASILEMSMAAGRGAHLVIAPPDVFGGDELIALLNRQRVTHAFLTPGALDTVRIESRSALPHLQAVVVGGDACPPELARQWIALGFRLYNAYGPTEITIAATLAGPLTTADPRVSIGTPIRGATVRVLDTSLCEVPPRVVGEMYLGGVGVAAGYHGRPALTASTFVADPDGPAGSRRFRSGDLARRGRDGFVHHGRIDAQVKIRGHRVEIGEIETTLRRMPEIESAAVLVRTLAATPDMSSAREVLVAYVTAVPDATIDADLVRSRLAKSLPRYMVPPSIMCLPTVPLTVAGKIDRAALPEPAMPARTRVSPEGEWEILVAATFADVLGRHDVGALDDFFDSGGDSLSATRVVSRIRTQTGRAVPVRALFDAPDVRSFAHTVSEAAHGDGPEPGTLPWPDPIPLSLAQQRMWFLNKLDPSSTTENIPVVLRLVGVLDEAAFEAALLDLVRRHDVLRTAYPDSVDGPRQVITARESVALKLSTQLATSDSWKTLLHRVVHSPFDVSSEPPVRAELVRIEDPRDPAVPEHVCAIVAHHIAVDGVSVVRLAAQLAEAYAARVAGVAPTWPQDDLRYVDYALWHRATLADGSARSTEEARYWRAALANVPAAVDLPFDRPRPSRRSGQGASVAFTMDADVHQRMARFASASGSSVFMLAHTALAVLLARVGDNADVVIGTPVSGRAHDRFDEVVGMFVNMLALRTSIPADATGREALALVRAVDLDAFAHSETPFDRVVAMVEPPRTRAHHPVFQVALSFQNIGWTGVELPGLTIEVTDADTEVAEFDLHLTLTPVPDGTLDARITYATDVFDRSSVVTLAERYETVLRTLLDAPDRSVGDLDVVGAAESVVHHASDHVGSASTLGSGFVHRVAVAPDTIAVVDGDRAVTYGELASRVGRIVSALTERGVGPDSTVAVVLPRGIEQIAALYAVVLAGGAYVPVALGDHARAATILGVADPLVVLTSTTHVHAPELHGRTVVAVDATAATSADPTPAAVSSDALAYVLFTSGSTGVPKGVGITHRAVSTQLAWMQSRFTLTADDAVLLHTSAGFDLSVWEYWWALQTGARLVVAPTGTERDADATMSVITEGAVTVLCVVPTALAMLVERGSFPASVRLVLCIGEALPADLVRRLAAVSDAAVHNLYGPTETAVSVTSHEAVDLDEATSVVPIGRPQPAVGIRVLDRRLRPVPTSVVGELYLTGVQLARGYHAASARTADAFVADPLAEPGSIGTRMYRTGDLVRRRADGELEYVSRVDRQVKIRGFRIEPGEIEAALRACDGVTDAVVVVVEAGTPGARLVAYVAGSDVDTEALPDRIRGVVPDHMVPRRIVLLESIPVTANGKVDRARLPDAGRVTREHRAPRTRHEVVVAEVISEVVGAPAVGLDDNFFDLGGNSLDATRVVAVLEARLQRPVPVRLLFECDRIEDLVSAIEQLVETNADDGLPLLRRREDGGDVALAPSQRRIRDAVDRRADGDWNVPFALQFDGPLDVDAVRGAIRDVVERHESLRTLYPAGPDGWLLSVTETTPEIDLVRVSRAELAGATGEFGWRAFDVAAEIPFRARIFDVDDGTAVLVVVVHHLSADGGSTGPLVGDMLTAFGARSAGTMPRFEDVVVRFRDHASWRWDVLRSGDEMSRQLDSWLPRFTRTAPRPRLRTDRPRPPIWDSTGAAVDVEIDAELHGRLDRRARSSGSGLFAVLQAAFAVVLADLAGDPDVAVATANANRPHPVLATVVGNFSEDVPMRLDVRAEVGFGDLVHQVRDQLALGLSAPDISAPVLLEAMGVSPAPDENVLFPATLILQDAIELGQHIEIGGVRISPYAVPGVVAKHELEVTVRERRVDRRPDGLAGTVIYPVALFDASTVEWVVRALVSVLRRVAEEGPWPTVGELGGSLS